MAMELRVPALGESVREATLGAWKHVEGDEVSVDEPLVEVESEKATVEVPSPGAGILRKILRKAGDTVAAATVGRRRKRCERRRRRAGRWPTAASPPTRSRGAVAADGSRSRT